MWNEFMQMGPYAAFVLVAVAIGVAAIGVNYFWANGKRHEDDLKYDVELEKLEVDKIKITTEATKDGLVPQPRGRQIGGARRFEEGPFNEGE